MPEQSQRLVRNSERSTWRRCRQRWQWSYVQMLEPIQTKGALSFGRLIHSALEVRYPPGRKRGPLPQDTFIRLYDEETPTAFYQYDEDGEKIPMRDLGAIMLEGYVERYCDDDHIHIVAPEMPFEVDVFDDKGAYLCTWVGRGDAVYVDLARSTKLHKVVGLMEHKTAKTIDPMVKMISGYGEQSSGYFWGASHTLRHNGVLPEGVQIDHVLFNWLRKAVPSAKPRNADGHVLNQPTKDALKIACLGHGIVLPNRGTTKEDYASALITAGVNPDLLGEVSKVQPSPLFHRHPLDFGPNEMAGMNWRIRAEAWEMEQARQGKLPIYKNPTRDCSWDCSFRDACEVHEMGGDWQSILELEFAQWNPYAGHELEGEKS